MAGLRTYYQLTKPGIIYGNALPLLAGYALVAQTFDIVTLLAALFGQSLVIAGACVFNNVVDRHIDKLMARTQQRALVTGEVSVRQALIFGTVLSITGIVLLYVGTNILTTIVGLTGLIMYVAAYGWAKRHTTLGTAIGAIPGALPPVAGYTAVTGQLDVTAGLLFLVLVFWQMPHFYAIGLYRRADYAAARLHILPLERPSQAMRRRIMMYVAAFTAASLALVLSTPVGYAYGIVVIAMGSYWFMWGLIHRQLAIEAWARKMFGLSLVALLVVCAAIAAGRSLP